MPKVIEDEKVFQAVLQTVVKHGYSGATTKQMADAAHISEVTLFRKYGSKLQLVKRAISNLIYQADFGSVVQYTGDVQADLLKVAWAYQDTIALHGRFVAALFSEVSRNPELADLLEHPLGLFYAVGRLLAQYQAVGVLRQEHPLHAAAALLGPLLYAEMLRSTIPQENLPSHDLQNYVTNFLGGRCAGLNKVNGPTSPSLPST